MMKKVLLFCVIAVPLFAAKVSDEPPEGAKHWSVASLKAKGQELGKKAAGNPDRLASEILADFPNELFMAAHREKDGQPELHETQADIFVMQTGSATLLVGGTLKGAQTIAPHELRNGTIEGGTRLHLSAGDIVRIPARTPHQLLLGGTGELNYFVVKIKGY